MEMLQIQLARLKTWQLIELIFMVYGVCKYSVILVLLFYYISNQSNSDLKERLELVQRWMKSLGSIYRQSGTLGIFGQEFHVVLPLCFYFPDILQTLRKPQPEEQDQEELSEKALQTEEDNQLLLYRRHLDRVVNSSKIFANQLRSNHYLVRKVAQYDMSQGYGIAVHEESGKWGETARSLALDQAQLFKLLKMSSGFLSCDKAQNRYRIARRFNIFFFTWTMFCIVGYHYVAYQDLDDKQLNFMEYFSILEGYMLGAICLKSYLPAQMNVFIGFLELMSSVRAINARFHCHLRASAKRLAINLGLESDLQDDNFDPTEALQLYLTIQIFTEVVGQFLRSARVFIIELSVMILSVLVPIIILSSGANFYSIGVNMVVSVSLMVTLNCAFLSCSIFSASCTRVFKLAWPLVANAALSDSILFDKDPNCDQVADTRASTPQLVPLMSSHTLVLWRKFIEDKNKLTDLYTCNLLGGIKLDHAGVIRINVWLIYGIIFFRFPNSSVVDCSVSSH